MKKITMIVLLVWSISIVNGQVRFPGELRFQNVPGSATITLISQSTAWDEDYDILTNASYLNITINNGQTSMYLDFITDDAPGTGQDGTVAYSLYEVSFGTYSFYIDYRDCNYAIGSSEYNATDIILNWNSTTGQFTRTSVRGSSLNIIAQDEVITAWGDGYTNPGYSPSVSCLQASNPTALTALSDYNHHPRFTWTGSEPSSATYNIWRKFGRFGTYTILASNVSSTTYTDYTVSTSTNGLNCRYKVNAVNNSQTSPGFTNEIQYRVWNSRQIFMEDEIPITYNLQKAYPNPFNPKTTIQYGLPVSSHISFTIHNMVGQLVKTIQSKDRPAGVHSIQWNSLNDAGEKVPSGMYIVQMKATSTNGKKHFTNSQKIVLLK